MDAERHKMPENGRNKAALVSGEWNLPVKNKESFAGMMLLGVVVILSAEPMSTFNADAIDKERKWRQSMAEQWTKYKSGMLSRTMGIDKKRPAMSRA